LPTVRFNGGRKLSASARQEMVDQTPDVRFQAGAVPEQALTYPENEAPCLLIKEIVLEGREAERFQWAL
jgi:hemolysin activation/secretion protein